MDFVPEFSRINLNQKIAQEVNQNMFESDLLVPDVKPDIAQIIKVDLLPKIEKAEPQTDRVSFSGRVDVNILYLSKSEEKPLNSMSSSVNVDDFIYAEGVCEGMNIEIVCDVCHSDYKLINDRKINVKMVLETSVIVSSQIEKDVICDIPAVPDTQVLKIPIKINHVVDNKYDRFTVKEEMSVPSGSSNIREILSCNVDIINKDIRAQDGRVSVKGDLVVKTLFISDTEDGTPEYMEHEIPFNGYIESSQSQDGMFAEVSLKIADNNVRIRQDSDGEDRGIEVEANIDANVKIFAENTVDMIDDAYMINKDIVLEREKVDYPKTVCRNKNQFSVRETILLPDGVPKMMHVHTIYGKCRVDNVAIETDKVQIDGIVDVQILYIEVDEPRPISSYKSTLPFKQTIETKGAAPDMRATIDYSIAHSAFSMLSGNEIEVRYLVDVSLGIFDHKQLDIVVGASLEDLNRSFIESIPSLVVYFVEKGDTLWKIARKYNTSVDDILSLNDIEADYKIYPGQKLIIVKRGA